MISGKLPPPGRTPGWRKYYHRVVPDAPYPIIDLESHDSRAGWAALFGRDAPLHLEIGFGRGDFLLGLGRLRPEINLLGIEIREKKLYQASHHLRTLPHVRLALGAAHDVLREHIPPKGLSGLYINCPDPWPKKRHRPRRLLTPDFIALAGRAMAGDAILWIRTDITSYGELGRHFVRASGLFREIPPPAELLALRTAQELKRERQGAAIFSAAFLRLGGNTLE